MRLLVIEDEPDLANVLRLALTEDGYAVDVALDGIEGLYKAETWPYDAIVLDLMIPHLDGWELLKRVRQRNKVPILILTARDAVTDRIRGLDLGADDYLVKPFELSELMARLRALIRRSHGEASSVLQIADVRIDTALHQVYKGDMLVHLTPREYALVELLALNQGRLVKRTALYEHLYGEDDDSLSNVLDVYVSNLRKKLGKEFIKTRRGEGYFIDV